MQFKFSGSLTEMARGFHTPVYWQDLMILIQDIEVYIRFVQNAFDVISERLRLIENVINNLSENIDNIRHIINDFSLSIRVLNERMDNLENYFCDEFKDLMPMPYSGQDNWHSYLIQFELIADIRRWNYGQRGAYLAASLVGEARNVLLDIPPENRSDFRILTEILSVHFVEKKVKE